MKNILRYFGGSLKRRVYSAIRYLSFVRSYIGFREVSKADARFSVLWANRYPCLYDNTGTTGYDRHYVLHTAWAARILAEEKPSKHVDISSSLYFCAISSAFVPTEFYDYRPANLGLDNLVSKHGDLTSLPFEEGSVHSLSCMHVVEHVGLGRYGDPVDPAGDLAAISELKRVLAANGTLLFVVPVGKPKVEFNAHRIYSYEQIVNYFEGLTLIEFALIPDSERDGTLIRHANPEMVSRQSYACGCFFFKKLRI